ncbi:hypothetical protein [Selenomonas sp. F0473]|uniref:hypothetical protein n=1 Tax=Selenomonas sp. F0473 TaxID=999423 RepID=UPI00030E1699|nr:hypothetical protein [Selenomonas sp. F0473]
MRVGYGTFRHSTGVSGSAYTRAFPVARYFEKILYALRMETEDGSRLPRKGL